MKAVIDDLIRRYENGGITRSQLVHELSLFTVEGLQAGATTTSSEPIGIQGGEVDHISIEVSDMQRSVDFYCRLFNYKVVSINKPNNIVRLGVDRTLISLHNPPAGKPPGVIDHFCIKVPDFDQGKASSQLGHAGVDSYHDIFSGFYVKDPDGVHVQMI